MIDLKKLVEAGVHYGHQTSRWSPRMAPYIWGKKNKVHLIDVSKTAIQLEKAAKFLEDVAAQGKQILWVGTKRSAQDIVHQVGLRTDMPSVTHRWIGGTLSNFGQVKKSVTRLLHYQDILSKSQKSSFYTKKELNVFQKVVDRLLQSVGGIQKLVWPLGAVVLVDVDKEGSALREASRMGIPVVALIDTNANPSLVDFVIPANDDSARSISIIFDYLAEAVMNGKKKLSESDKEHAKKKVEKKEAPAVEITEVEVVGVQDTRDEDLSSDDSGEPAASPKVRNLKKTNEAFSDKKHKVARPLKR
jgi:small subunit ribosomal protein S2